MFSRLWPADSASLNRGDRILSPTPQDAARNPAPASVKTAGPSDPGEDPKWL